MQADPRGARLGCGRGHFGARRVVGEQAPVDGGARVAQDGARPAGEHRREVAALAGESGAADGVDAAVDAAQRAPCARGRHRARPSPSARQLRQRHDAPLPVRELREAPIDVRAAKLRSMCCKRQHARGFAPRWRPARPDVAHCRGAQQTASRRGARRSRLAPSGALAFAPTGVTAAPAEHPGGRQLELLAALRARRALARSEELHHPPAARRGRRGDRHAAVHAGPVRGQGVPGRHAGRHDGHPRDGLPDADHGPRRRRARQALQPRARRARARAAGHPPDPGAGRRGPAAVDRHRAPRRRRPGLEHRRPAADVGARPHRHQRRRHHAVRQGGRPGQGLRLQPDLVRARPRRRRRRRPTTARRAPARPRSRRPAATSSPSPRRSAAAIEPGAKGAAPDADDRGRVARGPGQRAHRPDHASQRAERAGDDAQPRVPGGAVRAGRVPGQRADRQREGRDARPRRAARGPGGARQAGGLAAARAHDRPARADRPAPAGEPSASAPAGGCSRRSTACPTPR